MMMFGSSRRSYYCFCMAASVAWVVLALFSLEKGGSWLSRAGQTIVGGGDNSLLPRAPVQSPEVESPRAAPPLDPLTPPGEGPSLFPPDQSAPSPPPTRQSIASVLDTYAKTPKERTLIITCNGFCGGWGDRVKALMFSSILAVITNRHLIVDLVQVGVPLHETHDDSKINWRPPQGGIPRADQFIDCLDAECNCLIPARESQVKVLRLRANRGCFEELANELVRNKWDLHEFWLGEWWDTFFPLRNAPHPEFDAVIHVRTGWIAGDPVRYKGNDIVGDYGGCLKSQIAHNSSVLIVSDHPDPIENLKTALESSYRIFTGQGAIGHIEKGAKKDALSRLFYEFEAMRATKALIASYSGFSIFAATLRRKPMEVYIGSDKCRKVVNGDYWG